MVDGILAQARDCLLDGGVVLLPTDTVYGLAVHPERDEAAARLFDMKRRPRTRNLPVLVAEVTDLPALGVRITEAARRLLAEFAPGPLTLALGVRTEDAPDWLADRSEVGVRVPDDDDLRALLRATGPLLVTSANAHAQQTPESVPEILAQLAGRPDVVIDKGIRPVVPSTLVNCNLAVPAIERHGVLRDEAINNALR